MHLANSRATESASARAACGGASVLVVREAPTGGVADTPGVPAACCAPRLLVLMDTYRERCGFGVAGSDRKSTWG